MSIDMRDVLISQIFSKDSSYPDLNVRDIELFISFMRTTSDISKELHLRFADFNLSMGKLLVLLILNQKKGDSLTPSEIADFSKVTRGTITGLIEGLEKDEFITRSMSNSDRRMIAVNITEHGQAALETILLFILGYYPKYWRILHPKITVT
ncbi:MAG: MarR family transcriptional regulator [Desulfosporosinus sp.]|nr:MarR family transcriptional regulator [Desulfosporosinus sp.]